MAVNQPASKEGSIRRSAASRRLYFGTNVGVMIVLAAMALIGLNLLAHARNTRWDLTGGIAGYRVSDRTKRVLDLVEPDTPIRITTVYASTDPAMRRDDYFPRVRDLCAELRQHRRSIEVAHYVTGDDQARLRDRLQKQFGGAADEYNKVVTDALAVWSELTTRVGPYRQELVELVTADAWIGQFSTVANILALLQQDTTNIEDTRREVEDLIRGPGLPRFDDANSKIRELNNELHQHLEQIESWTEQMAKLVEVLADPQADFVQTTRRKLPELTAQVARLTQIAGSPSDTQVPEDPKPLLRDFARACIELADVLTAESRRVQDFVQKHPALRQHPRWKIERGIFVMDLSALLEVTAEELGNNGRTLRGFLQREDVALDQYQNLVRQVRQIAGGALQTIEQWKAGITAILDEGARIDPGSRAFLKDAFARNKLAESMEKVNQVNTRITELPEQQLDEIATRLGGENIIVVEVGDEVRVISFDEAWPIADSVGRQLGSEDGSPRRVFDGDSAISNALLAMVSDQPVAQVVLVTFEEEVPPEARQFRRPMTGPMPVESLTMLREKLTAMQFKVDEWNLAADDAQENKPELLDGVPVVYVFLPTPQPPSPFMRQQAARQFTEEDAQVAREILADGGRGLFLASWMPSMMMGQGPEYGWSPVLEEDWGIEVHPERRVIRGVVDRRHPGRYAIDLVQWWYMQLNYFREHPIGEPLRARRMLMKDVCPVSMVDTVPENVALEPVLKIPADVTDIWAATDEDIQRIFEALQSSSREGSFTKGPESWDPPMSVILAGRNTEAGSKVVVMGNGLSLRDDYLQQRVIRLGGRGTQLMTDPEPTENVDLTANALYWLADRPELIAAGPAEVPVVAAIEGGSRRSVWVLSIAWAVAALVAGGIVMVVRRK